MKKIGDIHRSVLNMAARKEKGADRILKVTEEDYRFFEISFVRAGGIPIQQNWKKTSDFKIRSVDHVRASGFGKFKSFAPCGPSVKTGIGFLFLISVC